MTSFADADLRALDAELERHDGPLSIWWRDDDAVAATPALDRLLAMAADQGAPIGIAAIPDRLTASLAPRLARARPDVFVLTHGWRHDNHAPPGEKTAEFGPHRPLDVRVADVAAGLARVRDAFGARAADGFTPPWNRFAPDLTPHLPRLGCRLISADGPRRVARPVPGLVVVNTHLDPIDWRGSRSAVPPQRLADRLETLLRRRREGEADPHEPIGVLTHHLVHDAAVDRLLLSLFSHLTVRNGLNWRGLEALLDDANCRDAGATSTR